MSARDRIAVTGVSVFGYHGATEHERRDGQPFVVDITLTLDLGPPAGSDSLTDTVDYDALAHRTAEIVAGPRCTLIETVAGRIAEHVLGDPRVHAAEVTVHKPHAPLALPFTDVAVTITRTRGGPA